MHTIYQLVAIRGQIDNFKSNNMALKYILFCVDYVCVYKPVCSIPILTICSIHILYTDLDDAPYKYELYIIHRLG